MKTSENVNEIVSALVAAQREFTAAKKDSLNPHFGSKYANLAAVWDACSGPLAENGLVATQDATRDEHGVSVTTRITHVSGQWMEYGPLCVPLDKPNAHGVGSAITYGRRFSLSAALGIVADDDDDGNAAAEQAPKKQDAKAEFFSRPDQSGMPMRKASLSPPPKQAAQTASAVDAARSALGFSDEQSSAGIRAWMDDKKGRFTKGQPIEDIGNDGLNFLLWLLNKGDGNPKFAAMDAARRAGIEAELKKRGVA